jgi:hypothetical protein
MINIIPIFFMYSSLSFTLTVKCPITITVYEFRGFLGTSQVTIFPGN